MTGNRRFGIDEGLNAPISAVALPAEVWLEAA